jgi:HAD superfamily hydrolase (TIGR01509 family)
MSHELVRGDIKRSLLGKTSKPQIFLDYGELIMHYEFNQQTLLRAHKIVLEVIDRRGFPTNLESLSDAHNGAIKSYLSRRKTGLEMHIDDIMTLVLDNLGVPKNIREPKELSYDFGLLNHEIAQVYEANDHDIIPMPTTIESLPKIQEIAKVGIISNLPHNSLVFELMNYGWYGFSPVVISHEVGYRKPHPAIYQEALRRVNLEGNPKKAIFFSHDQEEVDGALAVGMQAHLTKNLSEVLAKLETSLR